MTDKCQTNTLLIATAIAYQALVCLQDELLKHLTDFLAAVQVHQREDLA